MSRFCRLTIHRASRLTLAVGLGLLAARCHHPAPQAPPPPPAAADLIVLVPDPDDGTLGRATVGVASGAVVELAEARASTRVVAGQTPSAPTPMPEDEIARRFADAQAARPLPPQQFLLYFQSGGDELTPESVQLVPQIVTTVAGRPFADVSIIGHTDTTGDSTSNAALGARRANLIRDRLVSAGLALGQIEVGSHGESNLLVPTADNVNEPRNRRVEVTVR